MKKLISVILSLLMLFAVMAPAASAAEQGNITIYVSGYGGSLVDENGEYIWRDGPMESMLTGLTDILGEILFDLSIGMVTGNYDEYCDKLYNQMAPAFKDLILDENGEASDGSGWGGDMLTDGYSVKYNGFSSGYIDFWYDWRLSCEDNAEILEQFIDRVCREKGVSQVNLIGRCLGGNVVNAYLENGTNLDKVDKVMLYIPSTEGVDFISALFSGQIEVTDDNVDNFIDKTLPYMMQFENEETAEMIETLVDFINQVKVLDTGLGLLQGILDAVKDNVLARIVRDTYGGFVSYWNMVSDEYLEDAIAFVYNTEELQQDYAGMIEKIRSYHENVQLNARATMTELKESGKEFLIVSKYNIANFPLSKDGDKQSDGTALTSATSFGATVSPFGTTLSESYIKAMPEANKKYLSADNMIDASTCLFPENTWFYKNLYHSVFPACVDELFDAFIHTEGFNVNSSEKFPQYIKYNAATGEAAPVEGLDEGDIVDRDSFYSKSTVFMKILKMIFDFFSKLLYGEFEFSFNLGGLGA